MCLTTIRPDLMCDVSLISRFITSPIMSHWLAAKRIIRYLKDTIDHGIFYKKGESILKLLIFMDSDYASDLEDRRSTMDLYLC